MQKLSCAFWPAKKRAGTEQLGAVVSARDWCAQPSALFFLKGFPFSKGILFSKRDRFGDAKRVRPVTQKDSSKPCGTWTSRMSP